GWYNHPVSVSFGGSSFSGIASCTAPEAYGGPNTAGLTVSGTCTDNAGKTAPASYTLAYDASPPAVSAAADAGDSVINVNWQASSTPAPLASVEIARSPGIDASAASILYRGTSGAYKDTRVRNKIRYTYTITAVDQAGNTAVRTVVATPGARLLSPAAGAKISKPPTLAWTAVPKARYYNVQLWQGSHKILSEWPKRATLDLKRTWRFAGRAHRLKRGRYRWYVWPGFATRKAARYGSLVGSATFVVA
ncbi:MAG TPA: hypothetical protein VHX62_13600, partial [Solirubrobacteraceae bacterium]|nr:hypothetical protein [Solirubrobacteraceae bacterium]